MKSILLLCCILVSGLTARLSAQYQGGIGSGSSEASFQGAPALPLTLISFTAAQEAGGVTLRWTTVNEVGTAYFVVERTSDGRRFTAVGRSAAAGTSTPGEPLSYRLEDPAPPAGRSLYRLKSVDLTGTFTYSELVGVTFPGGAEASFAISPNPSPADQVGITLGAGVQEGTLRVEIFDAAGRRLLVDEVHGTGGERLKIPLADALPTGTYVLQLSGETLKIHSEQLTVLARE
ncbi:T9SS type A sorting domain-containing protein [Lewinella sp. IMCC34183]|uniref:T9SS type A sorting domain-containing protein n=1 Tax=Lewinella sp. IMCC34183 TaxID=2248762 RepID=UPI000E286F97|nr:T9SS type A sorting domain-containing protein [Lewinella sp. IMCC34183]